MEYSRFAGWSSPRSPRPLWRWRLAGSRSPERAEATRSNHTLRFTETQTASTFVDISHTKNGKPGDEFIFHSKLTKPSGGATVGSLDVACTLVFGGHVQCLGTATLPGGTLSVTALVPRNGNPPTYIAVNGGTGKFAKVRGDGLSTPTGATTDDDVFHLNY